jgi:hypothetical protein
MSIATLIINNNKLVQSLVSKLGDDLINNINNINNPNVVLQSRPPRTRTITPVPEHLSCTATLKTKGRTCSKKAVVGSLCTMHNKKAGNPTPIGIPSSLSDELVPSDADDDVEVKINDDYLPSFTPTNPVPGSDFLTLLDDDSDSDF